MCLGACVCLPACLEARYKGENSSIMAAGKFNILFSLMDRTATKNKKEDLK